jgi:hypothetical protein
MSPNANLIQIGREIDEIKAGDALCGNVKTERTGWFRFLCSSGVALFA